jgi:lambda repressor-like predicted transcriptional regulator
MDAGLSAVERAVLDTAITATYTRAGITDDPSALAQLPDAHRHGTPILVRADTAGCTRDFLADLRGLRQESVSCELDREWRPGEQIIVEMPDGQVLRCRILSLPARRSCRSGAASRGK